MIPSEISGVDANLPTTDDYSIVIITSNGLRHKRFALRLIEEFGDSVIAWFECDSSATPQYKATPARAASRKSRKDLLLKFVRDGIPYTRGTGRISQIFAALRMVRFRIQWRKYLDSYKAAETGMFAAEVARLEEKLQTEPEVIHPGDVNTPEFIARLRELDPYFLATLAGPLYSADVLATPRGIPINQHAGHSPDLKGSNTIEWALYRHQLEYASNTVHITTTGADSGPILRRSNPCLSPSDTPAQVFCRSVALGTELMIEVIQEIVDGKPVLIYPQPDSTGITYLGKDVTPHMLNALNRDSQAGWLHDELARLRNW